jgi:hypothetical protein
VISALTSADILGCDTETMLIQPWEYIPRLVCTSWSTREDCGLVHANDDDSFVVAAAAVDHPCAVTANGPFDLAVWMRKWPELTHRIFRAIERGTVHDVLVREKLVDIMRGTYKFLRGKGQGRGYGLEACVYRSLRLVVDKENTPRLHYGDLIDTPVSRWSADEVAYAVKDAIYPVQLYDRQEEKRAKIREMDEVDVFADECRQLRAKWAFHLSSAWGICVDQVQVAKFKAEVGRRHREMGEILRREGLVEYVDGRYVKKTEPARERMRQLCERAGIEPEYTPRGNVKLSRSVVSSVELLTGDTLLTKYVDFNSLQKLQGTYIRHLEAAGRFPVHAHFDELVDTGRSSCIAKGTLIEVVRDVSKAPRGIPIEQVKIGDLVYGYTDDGKLALRRVTNKWNNGVREVVRVRWQGAGHHHRGHVDMTPEHLIKTTKHGWKRADELKPLDRVYALRRTLSNGYARLHPTGAPEITREHRFILQQLHGEVPAHAHHKNGNKLDNRPENLEGLSAHEHLSQHGRNPSPELRAKRSRAAKRYWRDGRFKARHGPDCPNWLGLTKRQLLVALKASRWSVLRAAQALGHDFQTFKDYVIRAGFDVEELKQKARRVRRQQIVEWAAHAREMRRQRRAALGLPNNHEILSVRKLKKPVEVYDLEVEDIHNFIAGEICVHNCRAPNLQNPPRRFLSDEGKPIPGVRECYVPRPGCCFVLCDYDKAELVSFAEVQHRLFGRSALGEALIEGIDPHTRVAAQMRGISYEEAECRIHDKNHPDHHDMVNARNAAKPANFGFPGGLGAERFVGYAKASYNVTITLEQAKELRADWRRTWPEVNDYLDYVSQLTQCPDCLGSRKAVTLDGEEYTCPKCDGFGSITTSVMAVGSDRLRGRVKFTEAANGFFQMLTADAAKHAHWCVTKLQYLEPSSALFGTHTVNFVHDELIVEAPISRARAVADELEHAMVEAYREWVPNMRNAVKASARIEDRWRKG